jgi:hypothetical protein
MPAKGKSPITDAQRRKIAAGKLAGKTHPVIAAETGLAMKTVERQSTDPRTIALALELKREYAPQLKRTYGKVIKRVERDVDHKDHAISATARTQFLRMLTLGDPPLMRLAAPGDREGDFTLEELLIEARRDRGTR